MSRITSDVGLASGINIAETVKKLMEVASTSRNLLAAQNDTLKEQQTAVTELSALLLATRFIGDNLGKAGVFDALKATSANDAALGVSVTGTPAAGTSYFTPLRLAQQEQLLSSGVRSETESLGGGKFTLRFGDNVERSADLGLLQGGAGLARGKIRITDRSGVSAEIDLSAAQNIDDVLTAINNASAINVRATAEGDHIRLTDKTGQTGRLQVREVGLGTTAASLGLAGIDVAADAADGQDLLWMTEDTSLAALNDGNGVSVNKVMPDIAFTLRDGTTGSIDLSPIASGSSAVTAEASVGDVLKAINEASPGKLQATLSNDGKRIVLTDLTVGGGTFQLSSLYGSGALADLGLDAAAVGGQITGRRLLGGLQTVLLSSLGGGSGLGTLGALAVTDRNGNSATVDLSAAETLDDVVDAINAAGLGVAASVNAAKNGLLLTDTTGGSGNLVVADADASGTAARLNLAVNAAVGSVNSGDLHLQVVGESTLLSSLNGGGGVAHGIITLFDSTGAKATVDFARSTMNTVGDAVQAINRLGLAIQARINDTGDGILLTDTGGGGQSIRVTDDGSGAAADLGLNRTAVKTTVGGNPVQTIDGSTTYTIDLAAGATLTDLRDKIAALNLGVTARLTRDSSSRPVHLALSSASTGAASRMVVDGSALGLGFQEISRGSDALLSETSAAGGTGILLASPTNTFKDAAVGLELTLKQATGAPVAVSVSRDDTSLVANVKAFVANFNKFREKLLDDIEYDSATNTRGVLGGDSAALRLDTEMANFLSGRIYGAGTIRTIAELGISVKNEGTLELDEDKLRTAVAANPEAVRQFFTTEKTGFSARFAKLTDQLGGETNSAIAGRLQALEENIGDNEKRLEFMDQRLAVQQERMYLEFYYMEMSISKIRSALDVIDNITPWYTGNSNNSNRS